MRARLDSPLVGWARGNLDDMQAQLSALARPGFLRDVPAAALADYPRYLKALSLRAERALRDPVRDQQRMLELKPFADALHEALQSDEGGAPDWQALRWDLEELRVSLVRAGTRCARRRIAEEAGRAPGRVARSWHPIAVRWTAALLPLPLAGEGWGEG